MALTSSKACTRCSSWAKRVLSLCCDTVMRFLLGWGHAPGDVASCPLYAEHLDRRRLHPTESPMPAIVQPVPSRHFSGCWLAVNLQDGWNPWCQKEQILYTEFMH